MIWRTVLGLVAACPFCDTETGAQVRAGLFDGRFLENLALVLAPFPVFGAVVAWVYFGRPGRRGS